MPGEPRVRGRHMKSLLAALDALPPEEAGAVRLAPAWRVEIEDATGVDWLPAALNLEVTRAIFDGLGTARAERFFRETLRASFSGPLLRTIVEAAQRVFRVDAASFAGWVGTGWPLVFRDCGRWRVERAGDGGAALLVEELPPAFARDEAWLRSVAASLEAFFDVARTRGAVRLEHRDEAAGRARFRLSWS